jgi:hypothetical protein
LLLNAVGGDAEGAAWLRAELIGHREATSSSASADGLGYLGALAGNAATAPTAAPGHH